MLETETAQSAEGATAPAPAPKATVTVTPVPGADADGGTFALDILSSSGERISMPHVRAQLNVDRSGVITSGLLGSGLSDLSGASQEISAPVRLDTTVISRKPTRGGASMSVSGANERLDIFVDGMQVTVRVQSPAWLDEVLGRKEADEGSVVAPMPSKVRGLKRDETLEIEHRRSADDLMRVLRFVLAPFHFSPRALPRSSTFACKRDKKSKKAKWSSSSRQ